MWLDSCMKVECTTTMLGHRSMIKWDKYEMLLDSALSKKNNNNNTFKYLHFLVNLVHIETWSISLKKLRDANLSNNPRLI